MSFEETRFNDNKIIYNTVGGPAYKTSMVQTNSGKEQRNATWSQPLSIFEFNDRLITETEAKYIRDFFHAMQGMLIGFRFKDWLDYRDDGHGVVVCDGSPTGQLYKSYTVGSRTMLKKITKPVAGTIVVKLSGTVYASAVDTTTGNAPLTATTLTVTGVAAGSATTKLTLGAHSLVAGHSVAVALNGGTWTSLNSPSRVIASVDATGIFFAVDSTGFGTFTSGTVASGLAAGAALTWTGEYDLPVRFDADDLQMEFRGATTSAYGVVDETYFNVKALKLVELKQ